MARRNRKSRQAKQPGRNRKPSAEELQQERSFFIWAGVITLAIVALLYFVFLA